MKPAKSLPYGDEFASAEAFVDELLGFASSSVQFQILCGGVHILDFFTIQPGLFDGAVPAEWQDFLLSCESDELMGLLLRDDLEADMKWKTHQPPPPDSFLDFVRSIRKFSLGRDARTEERQLPKLAKSISVGMRPKKIHEVVNFADYVDRLATEVYKHNGTSISHFIDFGSGQNYLGRVLASDAYNKHVVAVEGREINVAAARGLDVGSGLAIRSKVMRNKKLWNKIKEGNGAEILNDTQALAQAAKDAGADESYDFRPVKELETTYAIVEGKGSVQYVYGRLDSGDLSDVIQKIDQETPTEKSAHGAIIDKERANPTLMAISIHSCGNLSHFAIRSLVLNPDIQAIAIVGCCYNLMTERLGLPTYENTYLRPTLQALNGRLLREASRRDPQGFPMSKLFCEFKGEGMRLNITARMMACQAPLNWTKEDSEGFFAKHFYRAVLQKIFLDRGVVQKVRHHQPAQTEGDLKESPFNMSTNPVIIGSLSKHCFGSFKLYVRGVITKLTSSTEYKQYAEIIQEKMANITAEEIDRYEEMYLPRKKEISIVWTLMAFSAVVVESIIVADRWKFLKEQEEVGDAWVEPVFDYKKSPRNLVVVSIKKRKEG